MYLARHMQPDDAQAIRRLDIPGVELVREYKRYYPAGEVAGHVLGFTSVDDEGQEGAELAFDHWLGGEVGHKRVIQDRMGRKVQDVENIRSARPGRDLNLSIDMRIQYLAYRELKAAIRNNRARSGSMVVIDVTTGEILAMVNQPTFNPNNRGQLTAAVYRNRAATDILEPGSSIKPFIVAAALESGHYDASSVVDTSPGSIRVGSNLIGRKTIGAGSYSDCERVTSTAPLPSTRCAFASMKIDCTNCARASVPGARLGSGSVAFSTPEGGMMPIGTPR